MQYNTWNGCYGASNKNKLPFFPTNYMHTKTINSNNKVWNTLHDYAPQQMYLHLNCIGYKCQQKATIWLFSNMQDMGHLLFKDRETDNCSPLLQLLHSDHKYWKNFTDTIVFVLSDNKCTLYNISPLCSSVILNCDVWHRWIPQDESPEVANSLMCTQAVALFSMMNQN